MPSRIKRPHSLSLADLRFPKIDPFGAFHDKHVVLVANPRAQDGAVAKEFPALERIMRGQGGVLHSLNSPDPHMAARRERILGEIREVLGQITPRPPSPFQVYPELPPVVVVTVGGDFTVWEAVRQSLLAAGVSLHPSQDPQGLTEKLRSRMAFILVDKGKAGDNGKQLGAPKHLKEIPRFVNRAVELPFRFPIAELPTPQGPHYEVAGHSYSVGTAGVLFALREENLGKNPDRFWNKGLKSYFRLLPQALTNRIAFLGFEAEVKHFGSDGRVKQHSKMLSCELMVTPNRLIAQVGGVPGAWGETKIVAMPAGGAGLVPLAEYVFRGLATKAGWNQVSPHQSMKTLSADRQIKVAPGEWVEVQTRVPNTLSWRILRFAQELLSGNNQLEPGWFYRKLGLGKAGPAIPPPGAPLEVPAQLNGDGSPPTSSFKVFVPDYSLMALAHHNSPAVRLARDSALLEGKTPLISDQQMVARIVPEEEPKVLEDNPGLRRVRTPFISLRRLDQALNHRDYKMTTTRISEIVAATQRVTSPEGLPNLADRKLTAEKIHHFLQGEKEQVLRSLGRRLWHQGVPLVAGVGALFAGEALADRLGLDAEVDRELRFALMVYLGHAAQANLQPLWEVVANRGLGMPYDFVRTRQVRVASETLAQWTYSRYGNGLRAMAASWRTGALAVEGVLPQGVLTLGAKTALIPLRAAWNMGPGLIASQMAAGIADALDAPAFLKEWAPPVAFFAPDLAGIFAPKITTRLLSDRAFQLGARAFAAGFIADTGFAGLQHALYGSHVGEERQLNARAARLRRERGDLSPLSWRHLVHFFSPTLADHIDSHEYGFGKPNVYRRLIRT